MLNYKIRIGLAPCRRWLRQAHRDLQPGICQRVKDEILPYIKSKFGSEDVEFVDLEF